MSQVPVSKEFISINPMRPSVLVSVVLYKAIGLHGLIRPTVLVMERPRKMTLLINLMFTTALVKVVLIFLLILMILPGMQLERPDFTSQVLYRACTQWWCFAK